MRGQERDQDWLFLYLGRLSGEGGGGVEGISGGGREVVEGLKGIPALKRTVRLVHFFLIAMM